MTYPPSFYKFQHNYGEAIYVDDYNRVYDKDKKQIKCKHIDEKGRECRTHLSYASNVGLYCSDNLLHRVQ